MTYGKPQRLLVVGPPGSGKDKSAGKAIKMLAGAGYQVKRFSFGNELIKRAEENKLGHPSRLGGSIQDALHSGYQNDFFESGLNYFFSSGGRPIDGIITSPLCVLDSSGNKIGGLPLKTIDYLGITPDSIINIVPDPAKVGERVEGRHPADISGVENSIEREYDAACYFRDHNGDRRIISVPEVQAAETIAKRIIDGDRPFDFFYLGYPISQCKKDTLIQKIDDFHNSLFPYIGRLIPIRMADKPDSKIDKSFIVWLDTAGPFIYGSNARLLMYYPESRINSDGMKYEIDFALNLGREIDLIKPDAGSYAFSEGKNPKIRVYRDVEAFKRRMEEFYKRSREPGVYAFCRFLHN